MLVESFSGIRGVYGTDLTGDIARRYAYSFYSILKDKLKREPLIVVGVDTRESSNDVKEAMFDSLLNIIDVGVMATPGVEFAVRDLKADGGIVVTASHNEPEFNGFKFLDSTGAVVKDMQKVIDKFHSIAELKEEDFLNNYLYKEPEPRVKKIKNIDIKKKYLAFLEKTVKDIGFVKNSKAKIVLDPVGGTASIAKELLEKLGIKVVCVNCNNGDFKRDIEPNEKSMRYLKDVINKNKADFAAGFDLDGDRMAILLKDGMEVSGNYILALLVDDVLSSVKDASNATVVTNDATSQVVKAVVEKYGAKLKEVEVGEINVVDAMYQLKSPVGGEGSCAGAVYPPSRCRDGILSLLFILKIIGKREKKLSQLIDELPVYYNLREAVKFNPAKHDKVKEKLKKHYSKHTMQEAGGIKGGLKVWMDKNSYIWFRASKTEADKFRIIADSNHKEKAEELLRRAVSVFNRIK